MEEDAPAETISFFLCLLETSAAGRDCHSSGRQATKRVCSAIVCFRQRVCHASHDRIPNGRARHLGVRGHDCIVQGFSLCHGNMVADTMTDGRSHSHCDTSVKCAAALSGIAIAVMALATQVWSHHAARRAVVTAAASQLPSAFELSVIVLHCRLSPHCATSYGYCFIGRGHHISRYGFAGCQSARCARRALRCSRAYRGSRPIRCRDTTILTVPAAEHQLLTTAGLSYICCHSLLISFSTKHRP